MTVKRTCFTLAFYLTGLALCTVGSAIAPGWTVVPGLGLMLVGVLIVRAR